ncbi:SH3 domain-containing protein [Roseateles sp. BYS96W]|uniref:SH3 domain-containing protein n=1 Tax=Pelomonas nitida TaxID=3299027 RepID=A0ABW7G6Q0_9BURK
MRAAALALVALAGAAQAQTGPHFIHGSWVNVREAAAPTARAVEQLTTNTPVDVSARQGDWCQLTYGAGKTGFVACSLLGPKPLTLAEAGSNAARAFWVAPSPNRLAAYGLSLPAPAALRLDVLVKTVQAGQTVRFPAVAEFEAAKKRMKAGVTLDPALEIRRPAAVDIAAVLRGYAIRPAAIRPSLFRTHESVALVSEADADGLAAVAGSKVSLTPTELPNGWFSRHNGPEIEGLTGFWDVGRAELAFDPPAPVYTVMANGLVSAVALRRLPFEVGGEGHYCGAHYPGKSLPYAAEVIWGGGTAGLDSAPLRGYPPLKEGSEALVSLAVAGKPLAPSAKVRTRSEPVTGLQQPNVSDMPREVVEQVKALKPRLVLREIDLDADGVADVLQIESPLAIGNINLEVVLQRRWFVNINGQWFAAGTWEDQDCT